MPQQAKKHLLKADIDFISKLLGILQNFRFKGKPYLSYLQVRERNDEFLMRDNVVKPLFIALGYHPQQDFSPEETIASGRVDTIIVNSQSHPAIVLETQSSLIKDLSAHRLRLFTYTEEIGGRFAVLSDGVRFEAWECLGKGKRRVQLINLNFEDIFRRFLARGLEGLTDDDANRLIKLKFLSKEFVFVPEDELYKEPELNVAEASIFAQLMADLQSTMRLVKDEIQSQFRTREEEWKEYQAFLSAAKGKEIYPSQTKKYQDCRKAIEAYQHWRQVSAAANGGGQDIFCTETMYILFNRLLLIRISEDKGLISRQISNGGIKTWLTFKGFIEFRKANYTELLRSAYETMNRVYPHLFHLDVFDWYIPDSETILRILFTLNRYNFGKVDRDLLGKLYEQYLEPGERKRLGEFYTPEEVIDYILKGVGYTSDQQIEGKLLLDLACGSGGFLVRAIKALVDRLKAKGFNAETILREAQRSIYGFDINPFAAHLAETNLLFQVIDLLNEAKKANPDFWMEKFNIFVTDSLRLPEQARPGQTSFLEPVESTYVEDAQIVTQIKARQGVFGEGFSFVIGNPPYVRTESITSEYKKRLARDYVDIYEGRFDLYLFFLGLGISLLNSNGGKLGFIVPGKFLVTENGGRLRQYILNKAAIRQMVDISQSKVFKDVGNYPVIVIFEREEDAQRKDSNQIRVVRWLNESIDGLSRLAQGELEKGRAYQDYYIRQGRFAANFDKVFDIGSTEETYNLCQRIAAGCIKLVDILETHQGIITGRQEAGDTARRKNIISASDMLPFTPDRVALCKKVIDGKNMPERYAIDWYNEYLIYAPEELTAPREPRWFESEKLVIQKISQRLTATYDSESFYCLDTLYVGLLNNANYNLKFILAILNSKLMDFYYKASFGAVHIGSNYLEYRTRYLDNLPIKPAPQAKQAELASLVDNILEVNRQLPKVEAESIDFPGMVSRLGIPLIPLSASTGLVTANLAPVQGIPRLSLDGNRISLGLKSTIEAADSRYARYLWLYLSALKDDLRGKTPSEIVGLIQVPNSSDGVEMVLAKRASIEDQLADLRSRRLEIDKQIDSTVNELYVGAREIPTQSGLNSAS
jgi:type I restriction-modification system DNA methylase subunit